MNLRVADGRSSVANPAGDVTKRILIHFNYITCADFLKIVARGH